MKTKSELNISHIFIHIDIIYGYMKKHVIRFLVMLLDPYNTSDYPITIVVVSLINIVVPLLFSYCYYCAP